jgi:hypothetical protein
MQRVDPRLNREAKEAARIWRSFFERVIVEQESFERTGKAKFAPEETDRL